MPDPAAGDVEQLFTHLRVMRETAHQDEQRDDRQRIHSSGGV